MGGEAVRRRWTIGTGLRGVLGAPLRSVFASSRSLVMERCIVVCRVGKVRFIDFSPGLSLLYWHSSCRRNWRRPQDEATGKSSPLFRFGTLVGDGVGRVVAVWFEARFVSVWPDDFTP